MQMRGMKNALAVFRIYLIYRIAEGRIAENWHIEDNLTLQQQLELIAR
jgi:predicted ester cyclase